jgi:hypothetical protein
LSRRGYRFLGVANDLALLSTGSAAALKVLAGK